MEADGLIESDVMPPADLGRLIMANGPELRGSVRPSLPIGPGGVVSRYVGSQAIMVARRRRALVDEQQHRAVIVSLTDSEDGYLPVARAADEAALRGWPLHIVHVPTPAFGPHSHMVRMTGRELLNDTARRVRETREIDVTTYLRTGTTAGNLVDASTRAGLLVVGVRVRGSLGALWAGSVGFHVTEYAHCPVMLVHLPNAEAHRTWSDHSVVVGVDGSPCSYAALDFAAAEAALHGGSVLAVHVVDANESRPDPLVAGPLTEADDEYRGVPLQRRRVVDRPRNALMRLSETASALVVGARSGGLHAGSVAQSMVRRARSPLFVVHEH